MTRAHRRVLVVEDDAVINQAVSDRLEAEGYDVVRAWDGPGAVAAYGERSPDLVVLDVMLPGYDGHEVCRRIQADRPVPVLMLTARADETDVLVGLGLGADDYLTKPFRMRELVARVGALLRRVARAAEAHALDEELPDLRPAVRRAHAQPRHSPPEAIQVILEPEEAAPPDVGHIVGRVRAQKSPVEDRDARLGHGHEPPVDEGGAARVRRTIRHHSSLHGHPPWSCRRHQKSTPLWRAVIRYGPPA